MVPGRGCLPSPAEGGVASTGKAGEAVRVGQSPHRTASATRRSSARQWLDPGGFYLPKSTHLSLHDAAALTAIEVKINSRPRKRLGWSTPAQIFARSR